MEDNAPRTKMRVYHRADEDLVLAWASKGLSPDQLKNVTIMHEGKGLRAVLTPVGTETRGITEPSILCIIKQSESDIDPFQDIELTVILGGKDATPITKVLTIHKSGVLPDKEKDRKAARSHLMGWDPETEMWTKIPLVKTENGTFAIPVVIVEKR